VIWPKATNFTNKFWIVGLCQKVVSKRRTIDYTSKRSEAKAGQKPAYFFALLKALILPAVYTNYSLRS